MKKNKKRNRRLIGIKANFAKSDIKQIYEIKKWEGFSSLVYLLLGIIEGIINVPIIPPQFTFILFFWSIVLGIVAYFNARIENNIFKVILVLSIIVSSLMLVILLGSQIDA